MYHLTQNRSFQRGSSQPISWRSTEETKLNTTKANNARTNKLKQKKHKIINLNECTENKRKPKITVVRIAYVSATLHIIVYKCHTLTQYRTILIIFLIILHTHHCSHPGVDATSMDTLAQIMDVLNLMLKTDFFCTVGQKTTTPTVKIRI